MYLFGSSFKAIKDLRINKTRDGRDGVVQGGKDGSTHAQRSTSISIFQFKTDNIAPITDRQRHLGRAKDTNISIGVYQFK